MEQFNYDEISLNSYLDEIKQKLYKNQKLLKLIMIKDSNPYDSDDIAIENIKHIFSNPFSDMVNKEAYNQLNFYVLSGRPVCKNDSVIFEQKLCFRILCHENMYECDYGTRPLEIVKEILKDFNQEQIGIYRMNYEMLQAIRINNNFAGYDLMFCLYSFKPFKNERLK